MDSCPFPVSHFLIHIPHLLFHISHHYFTCPLQNHFKSRLLVRMPETLHPRLQLIPLKLKCTVLKQSLKIYPQSYAIRLNQSPDMCLCAFLRKVAYCSLFRIRIALASTDQCFQHLNCRLPAAATFMISIPCYDFFPWIQRLSVRARRGRSVRGLSQSRTTEEAQQQPGACLEWEPLPYIEHMDLPVCGRL